MGKRFVSIGECMIEMSGGEDRMYRQGFAGDTLNTAWYMRALLPEGWSVDYVTALGDDLYSKDMRDFIGAADIGTGHIQEIAGKRPGLYMIHQAGGDRHFTYWRGQSAAKLMADEPEALDSAFAGAATVYFSGHHVGRFWRPRRAGGVMKADRQGARRWRRDRLRHQSPARSVDQPEDHGVYPHRSRHHLGHCPADTSGRGAGFRRYQPRGNS